MDEHMKPKRTYTITIRHLSASGVAAAISGMNEQLAASGHGTYDAEIVRDEDASPEPVAYGQAVGRSQFGEDMIALPASVLLTKYEAETIAARAVKIAASPGGDTPPAS